MLEDGGIVERRYRKTVIVIPGAESPFRRLEAQHDLAALQYRAVLLAEHRQQYPAFQIFAQWVPIDVEIRRIGRKFAPFENIEPPGIVGAAHCHMVRHDIEDEPHALRLQGGGERSKFALRADLRVQPVVIDDVVAMSRAGARFHQRRGIDVADAEPREIGNQRGGVAEGEALVKLQPVGCADRGKGGCAVAHSEFVWGIA